MLKLFILWFSIPLISFHTRENITLSAIKKESTISYSLSHPLHKVEATSHDFICKIEVNDSKEFQSVWVNVDVSTFDSGNSNRDSHAIEVIDGLSFPEITFKSDSISKNDSSLTVVGKMTFHGETQTISFPAYPKKILEKTVIEGSMSLKLSDFKVERPKLALIPTDEFLYIQFKVVFAL